MEEDNAAREAATSLISLKYGSQIENEDYDLSAALDFKEKSKTEEYQIIKRTRSDRKVANRGRKSVLEGDECQIISKEKFMQQAVMRPPSSLIIKDKSHLSPGTGVKKFTAAEAQEMQTKHGKNINPDKSNQKKEIGTSRNDNMIGKRVMMLMNGVHCYGTVASFKRSYEVLFDNGKIEEFLRRQVEAALVRDEAEAASASKKNKANSDE